MQWVALLCCLSLPRQDVFLDSGLACRVAGCSDGSDGSGRDYKGLDRGGTNLSGVQEGFLKPAGCLVCVIDGGYGFRDECMYGCGGLFVLAAQRR